MKTANRLIGLGKTVEFVKACLYTAFLKDSEKPVSFLLAAEPESGKTGALKAFADGERVHYLTTGTAYGITRDLLPRIKNKQARYLLMGDLNVFTGMPVKTKNALVNFLSALIEEGVWNISTYAVSLSNLEPVKCGFGATVTPGLLTDGRTKKWIQSGFMSRLMVMSYSYSSDLVSKIKAGQIRGLDVEEPPVLPDREYDVTIPNRYDSTITDWSDKVGETFKTYGIRAHRDLRQLAKALALVRVIEEDLPRQNISVNLQDIADLGELFYYFNLNYRLIDKDWSINDEFTELVFENERKVES
jgi:hypothetical protein